MYPMGNMDRFSSWMQAERLRREWSQNELATRAGIGRAVVNKVEAGNVEPAPKTLMALARAFGMPVSTLYRLVGYLPKDPEADALTEEGLHILQQLEGNEKEDAILYLRLRRQVQEERGKYNARGKKRSTATG